MNVVFLGIDWGICKDRVIHDRAVSFYNWEPSRKIEKMLEIVW